MHLRLASLLLISTLCYAQAAPKKATSLTPEQRTAKYFESIKHDPVKLRAFLHAFPKGGDLHNHLSGAIYAESYIQWASDSGLCINTTTMALVPAPATGCDPKSG